MSLSNASAAHITGATDVYLILGDPVEQVRAPETFNPLFAQAGIDAVLVPARVIPSQLQAFVRAALSAGNVPGLWVTIPHKEDVVGVLDHCSELGRIAGAVNAVRRNADGSIEGALFDGEALRAALALYGMAYVHRRVLLIGAGGAAAAIAASLALERPGGRAAELCFFDPDAERARALSQRITAATGCPTRAVASNDPVGFDLVINASPLGMKPDDPLPCDVTRMAPHAVAMDIVMKNQPTPWVRAARARGLRGQPGFEMLILQAHLYLDFFGFAELAEQVRRDPTPLRESLYPEVLRHEIPRTRSPSAAEVLS